MPATGTISPGLKFFGAASETDSTILRTRGSVSVVSSAAAALGSGSTFSIAVGLGLITAEAAAVGAVPLPFDNPDWDGWFYYETRGLEAYNSGSAGTEFGYRAIWVIDTKAMRKVQSGMVLALATQLFSGSNTGAATATVNQIISARALLKTS